MISNLIDCGRIQHDSDLLLHMILPIIVIKVIVSCILVPFLLKNLHGHTKLYNFLQQFSADLYSLTLIVPFILRFDNLNENDSHKIYIANVTYFSKYCFSIFSTTLGSIFFYLHYAFSLLQSLNYYHMICDSLKFKDYSLKVNVMKRIAACLSLCFIFATHHVVRCGASFSYSATLEYWVEFGGSEKIRKKQATTYDNVLSFTSVFEAVQLVLLKIVYTTILTVIALRIRSSLHQSSQMRNGPGRNTTNRALFFTICVVPMINNFLFLISDVSKIILTFNDADWLTDSNIDDLSMWDSCSILFDHYRYQVHFPLTVTILLLGGLINCSAYLYSFSQLRQGFCKCG